jgi:hypothetical protein
MRERAKTAAAHLKSEQKPSNGRMAERAGARFESVLSPAVFPRNKPNQPKIPPFIGTEGAGK